MSYSIEQHKIETDLAQAERVLAQLDEQVELARQRVSRLRQIKTLLEEEYGTEPTTPTQPFGQPDQHHVGHGPDGQYAGWKSSSDAILSVLRQSPQPVRVEDVLDRLALGGFDTSVWKTPYEAVKVALRRLTEADDADIIKVGRGQWVHKAFAPTPPSGSTIFDADEDEDLENVGGPTPGGEAA